jgi:hypothetical protein
MITAKTYCGLRRDTDLGRTELSGPSNPASVVVSPWGAFAATRSIGEPAVGAEMSHETLPVAANRTWPGQG